MSTADLLVELMFSWIEQREECAEELKKLAEELESLREKCNTAKFVGSSVAVAGGVTLLGAGVATFATGGLAAPFIGGVAAACSGVGVTVSVGTKITEHFMSSEHMKKAQEKENKSKEIADKIQHQFEQLKEEVRRLNPSADPEEVDQDIMNQFVGAITRVGLGLDNGCINDDELQLLIDIGQNNIKLIQIFVPELALGLAGILTFFTHSFFSMESKHLTIKRAGLLTKEMSKFGLKTALKGGAKAVGGALTLGFELPEMIKTWKDLIKNNHVTEASQLLRNTAEDILKMTQTLREQLANITTMIFSHTMNIFIKVISSSSRTKLIKLATENCKNETVLRWLRENSVFSDLTAMFNFLKKHIDEEEKKNHSSRVDITFMAHGAIRDFMIPASCLLPLSSIEDVVLYSPWNCLMDFNVIFGVATGLIKPQHRVFKCRKRDGCQLPDEKHQPTKLPNQWNSMKKAGDQMVPNIRLSPLEAKDRVWRLFQSLSEKHGRPGSNRIIIPFILPAGSRSLQRVPLSVITLALSLVLLTSRFQATVHVAACLGDQSAGQKFDKEYLKTQYACTIDDTIMSISPDMFLVSKKDDSTCSIS